MVTLTVECSQFVRVVSQKSHDAHPVFFTVHWILCTVFNVLSHQRKRMRDIHVSNRGSEAAGEEQPDKLRKTVRSHYGSSHFLFERAYVFLASRAFLVLSCPSVYNQFCSFSPVLVASVDDGSDVPISLMPGTSSNYGSPDGSGPDLDGMGHRSIDAQFKEVRDILLPLRPWIRRFLTTTSRPSVKPWGVGTSRNTSVEQTVNDLVAKMALLTEFE